MKLITSDIKAKIENCIIDRLHNREYLSASIGIEEIINDLYDTIPSDKRISFGIVHTVKELGNHLFIEFQESKLPVFESASALFDVANKTESRAVALCILSFHGVDFPEKVLPYFEKAAADDDWEMREISQILFRRLIKPHPAVMQNFLLKLVKSTDPNVRRFVGETLRPVCENKWFYKQPEYSLSVIRHLFKESKPYPRTSTGNNLSDLARHLPEMVYEIVGELVSSGDKNSSWIACRACRNLVKKEPERVLKILGTDSYKYKDRTVKYSVISHWSSVVAVAAVGSNNFEH